MMYMIKCYPEDFVVEEIPNYELGKGKYMYFLVEKRNYTTMRALEHVARAFRIKTKQIGYAGIKDKYAVTRQYISVLRGKEFSERDLKVSFAGYRDRPLTLGDLWGNAFEIVIRDIDAIRPRERFVNYYGEQRFSHSNAEIGKALIKGNFSEACTLLLNGHGEYEEKIREHLGRLPNDHVGALRTLPEKLLLLFVHSYQSRLWNWLAKEVVEAGKEYERIPLLGFDTEISDPYLSGLVSSILEKERVSLRDFIVRKIPSLTCEGDERDLYKRFHDLEIGEIVDGNCTVSFKLEKGAYATEALKALMTFE